jgi:hypothetical protein
MGKAINKAVACAEIVKRRVESDLHQHTEIGSTEVKDVYEPLVEGLSRYNIFSLRYCCALFMFLLGKFLLEIYQ